MLPFPPLFSMWGKMKQCKASKNQVRYVKNLKQLTKMKARKKYQDI